MPSNQCRLHCFKVERSRKGYRTPNSSGFPERGGITLVAYYSVGQGHFGLKRRADIPLLSQPLC